MQAKSITKDRKIVRMVYFMSNKEEIDFTQYLEQNIPSIRVGKTVKGKVLSITAKGEIILDLGYKADGIIPKEEFSFQEQDDPNELVKIGDEMIATVVKTNDGVGNVLLSCKKIKYKEAKQDFDQKVKQGYIFEEPIHHVSNNGFIVLYKGIRIFIPISLSGITRAENIEDYKGKTICFKVIEYDEKVKKIIGSVKVVKEEQKQKEEELFWEQAQVGKEYEGKVTSISAYGAFVDLGPVQGLLHVSEITWERNVNTNELLTLGQIIKVRALEVDRQNKRMKLTYEGKGPDPWEKIEQKYHINDVVKVKVIKFMPFGVFVELEPGIEGLVHISQICTRRITKPEEELALGQWINAKILELDKQNRKLELSIRELEGTSNE